eukprot:c25286_g1_i1.p1 GENE.c25286_g1_i1~~c25286_g1_i1.p1  ORF type:complete len:406 (+),score=108.48 c25286_g1_i1:38-1219(+)
MSDEESSSSGGEEDYNDLTNPDIITKYRLAGDFAKYALQQVIEKCVPGVSVIELCKTGDSAILEKTATVYNKPVVINGEKQKVDKGVAFPTCISVNNVLGNFCPRESDEPVILNEGDLAKIELAAHVDGYIAGVSHTIVVGGKVDGRRADVVAAARDALEASLRLLKPGTPSTAIPEMVAKIAEAYGVTPVEGVACNTVKRFVIEASKEVPIKVKPEDKPEKFSIEENEAYSMEFSFTTGEDGKCSNKDGVVTVYRRAVEVTYMLKLKASRQLFSEINTKYPSLPFNFRDLEDKLGSAARLGIKEIVEHDLLIPYPSVVDKAGEFIATFKCTCLVLPSGVIRLTEAPYPEVTTDKTIGDDSIKQLLSQGLKKNKKNKKKKKAGEGKGDDEADE